MLLRDLDDAPAALLGQRPPARVLEGRDEIEERRLLAARRAPLERIGVEAFVVAVQADDLGAELAQDLQRPVVGRALDEDALPGRKPLREEDEALERAVGDEDAGRIDAVARRDPFAQRRVARRRAVGEDRAAVALERGARAVGELVDGEAFRRGNAAREGDRRHGLQTS